MSRVSPKTNRRFGFAVSSIDRHRISRVDWRRRGSFFEVLEDRTLLSALSIDSVSNLTGLAIKASVNVQTTQDVATFTDVDAAAVPADFTATITWPGGGTNAGIITEDASDVFHVSGTHTFIHRA